MGATNVSHVYAFWSHLPAVSKVLLAYMALVSKDGQDPPTFEGGRDVLALALGRDISAGFTAADKSAVRHALAALKRSGAIALDREAYPGRSARYRLNLLPAGADPTQRLWMTARHERELRRHRPRGGRAATPIRSSGDDYVTPSGGDDVTPSGGDDVTPSGGDDVTPQGRQRRERR